MAKQPYNPIKSTAKSITGVAVAVVGSIVGLQLGIFVSNKILAGAKVVSRKVKAEYKIWSFKQELKADMDIPLSPKSNFRIMYDEFLKDIDTPKPYTGRIMDDWFGKGRF